MKASIFQALLRGYLRPILTCILILNALAATAKDGSIQFVQNKQQWPSQVAYKAEVQGGAVFLTNTGFTYNYYSLSDVERIHDLRHENDGPASSVEGETVHWHSYQVKLSGCNTQAVTNGEHKRTNYYNYFLGKDAGKWAGNVPAYEGVRYQSIYPKIDLNIYSKGVSLKYDFIVSPGGNANDIKLQFEGVQPTLTPAGDLSIKTSVNELLEKAPYAYQMINGTATQVVCRYALSNGEVTFDFPNGYNTALPLIIDPVLVFATYSGGTGNTFGWSATYDTTGSLYAGGQCFTTGWPVTTGSFQTTFGGNIDIGINKYSSNGSSLIYSTYYGGSNGDYPNTMTVNKNNELCMAGGTSSTDLPTTAGCYDGTHNGAMDIYVVHFNAAGSALLGATYVGGSGNEGNVSTAGGYDANRGEIFTDNTGNIYVAAGTNSPNFPTTPGVVQPALSGTIDGFVFKMNSACANLIFATYIGGSSNDAATALVLTSAGNIAICGGTNSTNFPGTSGGWQSGFQGGSTDGFIAILNSTGTAILNATYIGTTGVDNVAKIQIDPANNIYAMGQNSTGAFPVSAGVYNVANGRIYLAKLNPTLSANLLSTTIGATTALTPSAFMLDVCGNVYFVGYGASTGLPLTANAYQTTQGGFWMSVLTPNFASLGFASYFGRPGDHMDGGSSRMDPHGIVYHSICTANTTQPTTSGVWSPTKLASSYDIASWKFNYEFLGVVAGFSIGSTDTFCAPAVINFTNTTAGGQSYLWSFGDGSPNDTAAVPPPHTYATPGIYKIRLLAFNSSSCAGVDSIFRTIVVRMDSLIGTIALTSNDSGCLPFTPTYLNTITNATAYDWDWGDGTPHGTTAVTSHTYTTAGTYNVRIIVSNPASCFQKDTIYHTIVAKPNGPTAAFTINTTDTICMPAIVQVTNNSVNGATYLWDFGDGSPSSTLATPPAHNYAATGSYRISFKVFNPNRCPGVDSFSKNIFVRHDTLIGGVHLNTNDSGCVPYFVGFTNTTSNATSYEWNWGDGSPNTTNAAGSHFYYTAGTYTIRFIASNPATCYKKDTTFFTVVAIPDGPDAVFNIVGNDSVCLPAVVQFTNSSARSNGYRWDFGDGSPYSNDSIPAAHTYTTAGTYRVKLVATTNASLTCFPADSSEMLVHVFDVPAPVLVTRDTMLCQPDSVRISVGITNYHPRMTIVWSPVTEIYSNHLMADVTVNGRQARAYSVSVTNAIQNICSKTSTGVVNVSLWDKSGPVDTSICAGDTVQLQLSGTYDNVRWSPNTYLSDAISQYPTAWPPNAITYSIVANYRYCTDTIDYEVRYAPAAYMELPDSAFVYSGNTYELNPYSNATHYNWYPTTWLDNPISSHPTSRPEGYIRYYVTATTNLGCPVFDSIDIYVSDAEMGIPNAFTPGSGGPNRTFSVNFKGDVKLKSFQIYDRWGMRVFQTSDIRQGWDGTMNGVPQPMEVYVYMIEGTIGKEHFFRKGNVTLIR